MRKGVSTLRPASSHALQGTAAHAGKRCNCRPPPPWPQLHTQHTLPARQPTHVAYSSCVAAPPMRARTAMLLPWNSGRRRRLGTTPTRQSVGTGAGSSWTSAVLERHVQAVVQLAVWLQPAAWLPAQPSLPLPTSSTPPHPPTHPPTASPSMAPMPPLRAKPRHMSQRMASTATEM